MEPAPTSVAAKIGAESIELLKEQSASFLSTVLGEPAKALGGLLADTINARRHRNLINITVEANKRLAAAGVSPRQVPLAIIHPLLESASVEDDPDLQATWANLLANSADRPRLC